MGSWKKRFRALCAGFLALFLISTVFCDPAYAAGIPGNESGVVLTEDVTVSVVNKKLMASWMPETGGPGVWAFWRFGGMTLGLGAFGYLVRRRRNA